MSWALLLGLGRLCWALHTRHTSPACILASPQAPHLPSPVLRARLTPCRLERICLERWGRMEEQMRLCYSGIELRPPLSELRRMFRAAKGAGGQ